MIEKEHQALLFLTLPPDSFEHMITTVSYGKDALQMGEVEWLCCLTRRQRRKMKTTQDLHLFLVVRTEEKGIKSKDLTVAVGLSSRIAERECSATSARCRDT